MRHLATGQVEITSQNHNFAVDVDGGSTPPTMTHVNLNDGVVEGFRCRDGARVQRAVPPRGRARARTTPRYLFDEFTDLMDGRHARCRKRTDLETILIIGSGPIVIGQACEFDYSGTQACRVLRDEGYRVVLANSNPATIMTDPEFADAHLRRAARRPSAHAASSSASGPTRCSRRSVARPRSTSRWRSPSAGVLDAFGVELIGASVEAIDTAEDRERFKAAMIEIGLRGAARRGSPTRSTRRCASVERSASRSSSGPPFILGGRGTGIAVDADEFARDRRARARREPDRRRSSSSSRSRGGRSSSSR